MLIKPFGPLILHEVISEDFLNILVDASVQTKIKNENVGWDLAGNIDDQLQCELDPDRFVKEIYPHIFRYMAGCLQRRNQDIASLLESWVPLKEEIEKIDKREESYRMKGYEW